ncbi:MAG TPA: DUF1697 domain-containing protein [Solirubrobacteraceae bacterium]|nr:DUF1697 domain-containing protein [Solirubrobacteraceae bacterium]
MRQVALLRGINIGSRNRIAMPALREALGDAGYKDVETYVQSGNVVLSPGERAAALEGSLERLIEEHFGLAIPVVVRTRAQLARVVKLNPLGDVASDPKRYQVAFLRGKLPREAAEALNVAAAEPERVVIDGREVYAWHPDGVARSKLWAALASKKLGIDATARNWTTVATLLEMVS